MASEKRNFRVSEKNKTVSFVVGTLTESERAQIEDYRVAGYEIKVKAKKGLTIKDMRAAMKNDKKALDEFNALYSKKADKDSASNPFHDACKYYNEWKKAKKTK